MKTLYYAYDRLVGDKLSPIGFGSRHFAVELAQRLLAYKALSIYEVIERASYKEEINE